MATMNGLDVIIRGDDRVGDAASSISPWLNALVQAGKSGQGGGTPDAAAAAARDKARADALAKSKGSNTLLYVVLGVLGTAAVGVGGYFLVRRK